MVRELTSAGMSTRAIAPVVGADHSTVVRDVNAGGAGAPPARVDIITGLPIVTPAIDPETGEVGPDYPEPTPTADPSPAATNRPPSG